MERIFNLQEALNGCDLFTMDGKKVLGFSVLDAPKTVQDVWPYFATIQESEKSITFATFTKEGCFFLPEIKHRFDLTTKSKIK